MNTSDPDLISLARSILAYGIKEPLVITRDRWIISGHRRYAAARLAGLHTVPCRMLAFCRADDPDLALALLRELNQQRVKSLDEKLREEVVSCNREDAYEALVSYRRQQSAVDTDTFTIQGTQRRAQISAAKQPFLDAARRVIDERRKFWPLSVRQIHYALLNDPPLTHASKRRSRYRNDQKSYRALVDLLTRARLECAIPMHVIEDETRPVKVWDAHRDCQAFLSKEMDGLFRGYYRDLMQSQPRHVEVVGEKNTILGIVEPVVADYCIPLTIMRGYSSLRPRWEIVKRFQESGKDSLVLIVLSDFDPDGQEIAQSVARSIRDDFGVDQIEPVKAAITAEQIKKLGLVPSPTKAKKGSANYKKFVSEHGDDCYELEAMPPEVLQEVLHETIDQVIDVDLFNAEVKQEKEEADFLAGVRRRAEAALREGVDG